MFNLNEFLFCLTSNITTDINESILKSKINHRINCRVSHLLLKQELNIRDLNLKK